MWLEVGWRDAPLVLWNLAEVIKQIVVKILQYMGMDLKKKIQRLRKKGDFLFGGIIPFCKLCHTFWSASFLGMSDLLENSKLILLFQNCYAKLRLVWE